MSMFVSLSLPDTGEKRGTVPDQVQPLFFDGAGVALLWGEGQICTVR